MITIQYKQNDEFDAHRDLFVKIPEIDCNQVADTYYFWLDKNHVSYEIEKRIVILLRLWLNELNSMTQGATLYLPYDFSDEYTGCLRVCSSGDNSILLDRGCMQDYQGYYPSDAADIIHSNRPYEQTSPSINVKLQQLLDGIQQSIVQLHNL